MSELPKGWVEIPLGEVLQIQKGKKPSGLGPKGDDRYVPYINIAAFETKRIDEYAPQQDIPRCEPSDTLLVWDGARAGLAGRGIGGFIGSTLARLTSDLADPSYLYYFIHSNYGYLNTHTKGVGIPHIDPVALAEIAFHLPPLDEQARIVAKLEELLSDLDAGVAELKASQKKLAQYRQSLLKAAVEGTLTAEWRTKNTPEETGEQLLQRILTERRARWEVKQLSKFEELSKTPPKDWQKKYPEPVQPDTTDLPELPQGWVWASVDCLLADIETGKSFKCDERPPAHDEIGVVKVSAVSWGEYDEQESKTCTDESRVNTDLLVKTGDFLFSRANTVELVGACVIAKTVNLKVMLSDKILRLVLVEDEIKAWLLYLLRSKLGRKQIEVLATGNQESMKNIGQERLKSIAIPIAPKDEMKEALALAAQAFDSADHQIVANERLLKQATAQRQNILKDAFSGRLVPQDPNEEPASELMERILTERAERAKQPQKKRQSKKQKEATAMASKLIDVLAEAGNWLDAQEAFRRCGVADGASSDRVEELYAELRRLDKEGRLKVEAVKDAQGRKVSDKLKLLAN